MVAFLQPWNIIFSFVFLFFKACDADDPCYNYTQSTLEYCNPNVYDAAGHRLPVATNTCGMQRQTFCHDLPTTALTSQCEVCYERGRDSERHDAYLMTDGNPATFWASETLADNRDIHFNQSVNITLKLGAQHDVTYIQMFFSSKRPQAVVLYRKFSDDSFWTPWTYFSRNCERDFNMQPFNFAMTNEYLSDDIVCQEHQDLTTDRDHMLYFFPRGLHKGPDDTDVNQQESVKASQIKIEIRKFYTHTILDDLDRQTLSLYFASISTLTVFGRMECNGHASSITTASNGSRTCDCHPMHHTSGQYCEKCADGYTDVPWKIATHENPVSCKACNCNGNSRHCEFDPDLYAASGNVTGGRCLNCANNTVGDHCEICRPNHYRDSYRPPNEVVCFQCNCHEAGTQTYENGQPVDCNPDTGECYCKPGVEGPDCGRCKPGYYGFSTQGCRKCECNTNGTRGNLGECDEVSGSCYCKRNVQGKLCDSCRPGYFGLQGDEEDGCQSCFCFGHTSNCAVSDEPYYVKNITTDFSTGDNGWRYVPLHGVSRRSPELKQTSSGQYYIRFPTDPNLNRPYVVNVRSANNFLPQDAYRSYGLYLEVELSFTRFEMPGLPVPDGESIDEYGDDISLLSKTQILSIRFRSANNPAPVYSKEDHTIITQNFRFRLTENLPWNLQSANPSQQRMSTGDFYNFLSQMEAIAIRFVYGLDVTRVHKVTLMAVTKDYYEASPGHVPVVVEKCFCPANFRGDSCERCADFHRRVIQPSGPYDDCEPCHCNQHATECDEITGECKCDLGYIGRECEQCDRGYYRDIYSTNITCLPCGCPGGGKCQLERSMDLTTGTIKHELLCLECPPNQSGKRCERCIRGFYGEPLNGVPCTPCQCNENEVRTSQEYCNHSTGQCIACDYNTSGRHCERCLPGFYGKPLEKPFSGCVKCPCSKEFTQKMAGSDQVSCNPNDGRCDCIPESGVIGARCDQCEPEKYINGTHCVNCGCNAHGSIHRNCSLGICPCKPGVTGRQCDKCASDFYDFGSLEALENGAGCLKCRCDPRGTLSEVNHWNLTRVKSCDPHSGQCLCKPRMTGQQCDQCKLNFYDLDNECIECPPCYGRLGVMKEKLEERLREDFQTRYVSQLSNTLEEPLNRLEDDLQSLNNDMNVTLVEQLISTHQLLLTTKNNPNLVTDKDTVDSLRHKLSFLQTKVNNDLGNIQVQWNVVKSDLIRGVFSKSLTSIGESLSQSLKSIQKLMNLVTSRRHEMEDKLILGRFLHSNESVSNSSSMGLFNNLTLQTSGLFQLVHKLDDMLSEIHKEVTGMETQLPNYKEILSNLNMNLENSLASVKDLHQNISFLNANFSARSSSDEMAAQTQEKLESRLQQFIRYINSPIYERQSLDDLSKRANEANERYHDLYNRTMEFLQTNHSQNINGAQYEKFSNETLEKISNLTIINEVNLRNERDRLKPSIDNIYQSAPPFNDSFHEVVRMNEDIIKNMPAKENIRQLFNETQRTMNDLQLHKDRTKLLSKLLLKKENDFTVLERLSSELKNRLFQLKESKAKFLLNAQSSFDEIMKQVTSVKQDTSKIDGFIQSFNETVVQVNTIVQTFSIDLDDLQGVKNFIEERRSFMNQTKSSKNPSLCIYSLGPAL